VIAPRPRVLIADDHAPTRREIRSILEADGGFSVAGEVGDAAAAVESALRRRPDVCLIDVHMPGNGVAATREIALRLPKTKVVVLTVSDDDEDFFAALQAGAAGYLLKDTEPTVIPNALRAALAGEAAIPRALVARIVEKVRDPTSRRRVVISDAPGDPLTSREWQVLDQLRLGRSTREIAASLVLAEVTVRSHIHALLRKLQVRDRAAAVRIFQGEDASGARESSTGVGGRTPAGGGAAGAASGDRPTGRQMGRRHDARRVP
jgi:DNA-binding NarL/FixJ family response regulator